MSPWRPLKGTGSPAGVNGPVPKRSRSERRLGPGRRDQATRRARAADHDWIVSTLVARWDSTKAVTRDRLCDAAGVARVWLITTNDKPPVGSSWATMPQLSQEKARQAKLHALWLRVAKVVAGPAQS